MVSTPFRSPRGVLAILLTAGTLTAFAATTSKVFTPQQKRWWAFQKVVRPPVPSVKNTAWVKNDVDAFVLSKLEAKSISPNPSADKVRLIRRATLDLTGLPPTPEDVQAFVADNSPDAFAKVVDRLLASPHYGERWAVTGSTWPATPIAKASRATRRGPMSGAIATT